MHPRSRVGALFAFASASLGACGGDAGAGESPRLEFVDVAERAGVTLVQTSGDPWRWYIPESNGTGAAWLHSVVATLAPGLFPAAVRGPDGAVPVYFEAAAVITVLVLLGQVLELRARERTSGAIRALLGLAPKTARRLGDDVAVETLITAGLQELGKRAGA